MNRAEFFRQLEQQLQRVSKEEADAALEYYREYFDEAGPENEAQVIEELGSPGKLVTHLKAEVAMKQLQKETPTVKKGVSAIWWIILAIFAAPIALPLAIGAVGVCIGLVGAAIGIIVGLIIAVIAIFVLGILLIFDGFLTIVTSVATGIMAIGIGFTMLGISLLLSILVVLAARGIFSGIAAMLHKTLEKRKKEDEIDARYN